MRCKGVFTRNVNVSVNVLVKSGFSGNKRVHTATCCQMRQRGCRPILLIKINITIDTMLIFYYDFNGRRYGDLKCKHTLVVHVNGGSTPVDGRAKVVIFLCIICFVQFVYHPAEQINNCEQLLGNLRPLVPSLLLKL